MQVLALTNPFALDEVASLVDQLLDDGEV